MRTVFRLSKEEYANTLSGYGASIYGGRWNSKGIEVIYTSESRALAMAELLVHLPLGLLPKNYKIISVNIPDELKIKAVNFKDLPKNWNKFPFSDVTSSIGDEFIREGKYPILKVPSAIIKDEFNYLINPHHKDFNKIKLLKVEDFIFNDRLFK